ncbi:CARDB domain-containing protein [uncultured Polaribacter sp.]|uniref:CARDB domain-containing protein n=1 Tax=uncultured Polaribacter sp. TaxID=174711 RepID=UPI00260DD6D0|nr:CARDB domain-containing protein [uncultured Polaribacter sp.]
MKYKFIIFKRIFISFYFFFIATITISQEKKWPFKDNKRGKITGTVSDFRSSTNSANEGARFHGGVDLTNGNNRAVYAINDGNINITYSENCWTAIIQIGNVQYKHIRPGDNPDTPNIIEDSLTNNSGFIKAGDFIGVMFTSGGCALHVHINDYPGNENRNYLNNILNPFNDEKSPEILYPLESNGEVLKANNPLAIEFRENGFKSVNPKKANVTKKIDNSVVINSQNYRILYDKVDVVLKAKDQHILSDGSGGGSSGNNGVNFLNFSIFNYLNQNIDNHEYGYDFNKVPNNNVAQFIFDNYRSTRSQHVYILTSNPHNKPHDRYWNTRLKKTIDPTLWNTSEEPNINAEINSDAHYSDNIYYLKASVGDISNQLGTESNKSIEITAPVIIDNFNPYIERVLYIHENNELYKKWWQRKDSNYLEAISNNKNKIFRKNEKIKIALRTSEPMKEVTVSIIGTSLIDLPMKARTIGKNSWEVDINYSCDNCNSEEKQLEFKGLDLNNNGLLNDIANISNHLIDRSSSNKSALQKRNNSVGFDRNHKLNSEENCNITANAGTNKTIQKGESIQLQGSGGSSYSWSPTTGLSNPNIWNPIASPSETTTYTLTVTENGCTDTDTVTVNVNGTNGGNAPSNDDCSNATLLTSNTSCNTVNGTVKDATPSVGANNCLGCSCTSPDDHDVYYKFKAVATSHTVKIDNYSSDFDAVIELRTSCSLGSSNVISCYDPTGQPSSVTRTWNDLNIGQTYYIRVFEWNYSGDPPSSPTFDICVTHNATSSNGIDLTSTITKVSNDNPDSGDKLDVDYEVSNIGDTDTGALPTISFYLSKNQSIGSSDEFLGADIILQTIAPNETVSKEKGITIPNVDDGQYYLIVAVDYLGLINESNYDNNINVYPIYIGKVIQNGPDLDVTGLSITPRTNLAPNQEVEVEIEIENKGNKDADSFDVLVFLDIDDDGKFDQNELMREFSFGSIDADEEKERSRRMFLPSNIPSTGNYEVIVIADINNDVTETDENNNDRDRNVTISTINPAKPDLVCNFIKWEIYGTTTQADPKNLCLDTEYKLYWEITNIGNADISGGFQVSNRAVISKDQFYDGTDIFFDSRSNAAAAYDVGDIVTASDNNNWEAISPGDYYLLLIADDSFKVDELNEQNNVKAIPITFVNCIDTKYPDIKIEIENYTPYSSKLGDYITVDLKISNIGDAPVSNFDIELYFSEDEIFHGDGGTRTFNDHKLVDDGDITFTEILNPGESSPIQMKAYLRSDSGLQGNINQTGINYLFAVADEEGDIFIEYSRENNITYVPINLTSVDCYYNFDDEIYTIPFDKTSLSLFDVKTEENCNWTANGVEDWIKSPINYQITGNGTVYLSLQNENPYPFPRIGHININGKVFEFIQEARPCDQLDESIKMSFSSQSVTNIDCFTNGNIDVEVQKGFPPYTYSWSNGETTQDLLEITEAGNYTLKVTDISGCTLEKTFTVNKIENITTEVTLNGNSLVATQENTQYQWLDCDNGNTPIAGATNKEFTPSAYGNYAVKIIKGSCEKISECKLFAKDYKVNSITISNLLTRTVDYESIIEIENTGTIDITKVVDGKLYISPSSTFNTNNATLLSDFSLNPISLGIKKTFKIPVNLSEDFTLGSYYIHFILDPENNLLEYNENDNNTTSNIIDVKSQYDIKLNTLSSSSSITRNRNTNFQLNFSNKGISTTNNVRWKLYYSKSNVFDSQNVVEIESGIWGKDVRSNDVVVINANYKIPLSIPLGNAYLFAKIDSENDFEENIESDNLSDPKPITIRCTHFFNSYSYDIDVETESETTGKLTIKPNQNVVCDLYNIDVKKTDNTYSYSDTFDGSISIDNLALGDYEATITFRDVPTSKYEYKFTFSVIENVFSAIGYIDCNSNNPHIKIDIPDEGVDYRIKVYDKNDRLYKTFIKNSTYGTRGGYKYQNMKVCVEGNSDFSNSFCYPIYLDDMPEFKVERKVYNTENPYLELSISGGIPPYSVDLFDQETGNYLTEVRFNNTVDKVKLNLDKGVNILRVQHYEFCDDTFIDEIIIFEDYSLFPNPTNTILKVGIPKGLQNKSNKLVIFDSNGKKVHSKLFDKFETTIAIDVSKLPSGFYFISVYDENDKVLMKKKFLKN